MTRDRVRNIISGITDEQLQQILDINSADIGKAKEPIAALQQQLTTANNTISELEKNKGDVAALQSQIDTYKQEKADREKAEQEAARDAALIAAIESIINAVGNGLNWVVDKYNSWAETGPWGEDPEDLKINWQASTVSLPRLSVPALAQGKVLPPNKPFLAMVGDQKQGTNVEAPLSVIEDALRNVMSEQDYNFNITAEGSLGTLIRLLNLQINRENTRKTAF